MSLDSDLKNVVEAIDNIKSRNRRPNLPALACLLTINHGFSTDKTINLVKQLLSLKIVKEVVYKGNISFRNMLTWRGRGETKRHRSQVNSSDVVSTMLRLLVEDQESNMEEGVGGITETRLHASLIQHLKGKVRIQEIRKRIQMEVLKGTLEKNNAGDFVLSVRNHDLSSKMSPEVDLDMDLDPEALQLESSPELSNYRSQTDTSKPTTTSSPRLNKSQKPTNVISSELQNLSLSIENVVKNVQNTDNRVIMTEREIQPIRNKEEITCQSSDRSSGIVDNKRRRVIRKKKIYDPSEFEQTPPVKKKSRNRQKNSNTVVISIKEKTGRGKRGGRGSKSWNMSRDSDSLSDVASHNSTESLSDNLFQQPPKVKYKKRTKPPPPPVNKKCFICLSKADKKQPLVFSCTLCLNIAHRFCIKRESFYEGSRKWRCDDCKIYNPVVCSVCEQETHKKEVMLLCDFCEEFFHSNCHYPPVQTPLADVIWRCSNCSRNDKNYERVSSTNENQEKLSKELVNTVVKSEYSPTSNLSCKKPSPPSTPPLQKSSKDFKVELVKVKKELNSEEPFVLPITLKASSPLRHKPDEPIPVVDDWTVEQVSDYFLDKFGQEVADAFKVKEIDGKLLKEMSRERVTNDLGLHLGIALKVLYYVKKIQLGTNLFHQLWA